MRKNRWMAIAMAAVMAGTSMPVHVFAEEAVTEAESEQEMVPETEKAEDFVITLPEGELPVENQAGLGVSETKLEEMEAAEGEALMYTLTLTDENGTDHVYEKVDPTKWSDVIFFTEDGFYLMWLKDPEGARKLAAEKGEEITFDEPQTKYALDDVSLHAEANVTSDKTGTVGRGMEVSVLAAGPRWCKVVCEKEDGEVSGYMSRSFLTSSKEEADAAVSANDAARAAQEAAAAAAAAQAAAAAAAAQAAAGPTEVSRQQFPDCDGSGHGYYEITYSDGHKEIVEY